MKSRFLYFTFTGFSIFLLSGPISIASSPLSNCFNLASGLSVPSTICNGVFPESFSKNLRGNTITNLSKINELGIILRKLGYLEQAKITLNRALELSGDNPEIKLNLANVEKQIFKRKLNSYLGTISRRDQLKNITKIADQASLTLNQYENLFGEIESPIEIKAALNWLSVWASLDNQIPELEDIRKAKFDIMSNLAHKVDSIVNSTHKSNNFIDRLSLSESLWKCRNIFPEGEEIAQRNTLSVIKLAEVTNDLLTLSKANGLYATILTDLGDNQNAISRFEIAINLAKSIGAIDLSQKWQAEIGELYNKIGNRTSALAYYESSISDIEQIQKDILPLKNEIQFDFRDRIEPTYREYLELLFKEKQPNLKKVLDIYERLQIGELENYLQCSKLGLGLVSRIGELPPKESPDAAIYLIQMPHQYALILRDKYNNLTHRTLNYKKVNEAIKSVRQNLQGAEFKRINNRSMKIIFHELYNEILSPVEKILPKDGNIVWVVDSKLQNIPWGLLSDGSQYLFEKYLISYSLGTELESPKAINPKNLSVLIAGSTIFPNEPSYSSLPSVVDEIKAINNLLTGRNLLNKTFTYNRLLRYTGYPIIHIASHAQYSSNPDESFILSWESRIKMQELQKLVQTNGKPLELLVLSACESAEGDSRATLGLAGTAVRSGARSTVASLWLVPDESQVMLMGKFYEGLKNGQSRAMALQQAQIYLMNSEKWDNPYYWANMMLLGSYR